MKKTLALILAAMMVAGTASVAFASTALEKEEGGLVEFVDANDVKIYNEDTGVLESATDIGDLAPGETLYYELQTNFAAGADDQKEIKKIKVKADWTYGKDLVESVKIEYKKDGSAANAYAYYVAIATKKSATTAIEDLVGDISLYKTSPKNYEAKLKLDFETSEYKSYEYVADEDIVIYCKGDDNYIPVAKFKNYDESTVITFDGVGEFEVNLADQTKLFLGFNKDVNKEINDKYDYAELEFVNFPGKPAFFRTGTFYLYSDDTDRFVYALNDGKLEAIKATYDEEYDAYKFALRQFPESLILSDTELEIVNDETSSSEAPAEGETTPSETVKPNPGTGR